MGGMRKPKAKKRPGKVGRVNKFKNSAGTGCGTGAGGFKAGNNCQKEDGVPNSPQKPYIAKSFAQKGKSGKAASLPATKEALAAKAEALKGIQKSSKIAAARKKAAIRKKEKEAKAAEESKQRAEALAKKKAEMLKVIRKKRANEKLNILGDKTVDVQQINKNKALAASKKLEVVGTPKSLAQEIAEAKAAAAAKTAAAGKPAPYKRPDTPPPPDPPSPTPNPKDLTIVKPLGGSTGAKLAKDAAGNQYVIKGGNSADHIRNESAADELYRAAGVNVPKQQVHDTPDGPQKVAEFIKGKTLQELKVSNPKQYEAAVKRLRKDFVVDALLGNRDVVGMNLDNIVVGKGGKVFRVDNGGSLTFRAQGKQKDFGPDVDEINTLRDPTVNPSAASVFGRLTDKEVSTQINALMKKKQAVLAAAPNQQIREALEKRFDSLAKWQADFKKAAKASNKPKPSSTDVSDELTANVPAGVPKQTGKGWSWKARQQLASKIEPSLTSDEKQSITSWGGSSGPFKTQDKQHGADAPTKGSPYYKNFVSALAKLPQFIGGTVYRGMKNVSQSQVDRWLKEGMFRHSFEDAWDNTTHASMSTSRKKGMYFTEGGTFGRILVKVSKTKRAKDSSGLIKSHPTEEEVFALPGAKYKIRRTYFMVAKGGGAFGLKKGTKVSESEIAAVVAKSGVAYSSGGYNPHKDSRLVRVLEVEEIW